MTADVVTGRPLTRRVVNELEQLVVAENDEPRAACYGSRLPFLTASTWDEAGPCIDLCDACPVLEACNRWAMAATRFDGVAAGALWVNGHRAKRPPAPRPDLLTSLDLRRFHHAFDRGDHSPAVVAGERAYQHEQALRTQLAARAAGDPTNSSED